MTGLLDAVDELTLPKRVKVMQDDGVVSVSIPPLLTQLDDAVRSSMGGSQAGASLAFTGSVVNDAALYKLMQIGSQVRDWCRLVGARVDRSDTGVSLRRWYARFPDDVSASHETVLRSWAAAIGSLLDPPRLRELPEVCPVCGASEWWRDGERFLHPLVVLYRVEDPVGSARGMCRACEHVWSGRELSYALEQGERA